MELKDIYGRIHSVVSWERVGPMIIAICARADGSAYKLDLHHTKARWLEEV